MIKNAKAKGSRIERKLRDWLLEFQGFDHVLKAGGSLGVFDLIAFGACAIWFVQVKANRWPSPAECEGQLFFK